MTTDTGRPCGLSDRDRLAALADAVNDTARMARVNISIMLLVALYMAIMILLATDENLFRDAPVTLPYFVIGISLKESYLVAPPVFIWLHFQTLLLLAILARKIDGFETALRSICDKGSLVRREYRTWLSAANFVQSVQDTGGVALFAKILMWFGVAVIPPLLLFLVDMSFLKYQSTGMTTFHRILFWVDLISVGIFWLHISGDPWRNPYVLSKKSRAAKVVVIMLIIPIAAYWVYARPVEYGEENDRMCWKQWRIFCRNLSLEGAVLVGPTNIRDIVDLKDLDTETITRYRRFHTLDVKNRSFRYANLKHSYLSGVDLDSADLRNANFEGADLFVVSLRRSDMRDSSLKGAELSDVDLTDAFLHRAVLEETTFLHARLLRTNLEHAKMKGANLSGAYLNNAMLPGAILENSRLPGTDLSEADMSKAELKGALLLGVRLSGTELYGAVLEGAIVVGAVGQPNVDGQTKVKGVVSDAGELRVPSCAEDEIRCYLDSREVESDLALAWKPSVTLISYLQDISSRAHVVPDWLQQHQQSSADR